jgi:hypothetical protein
MTERTKSEPSKVKTPPVQMIGDAEPEPAVVKHHPHHEPHPERTEVERVRTTPILGLHPSHTEAQIEARYVGFVQGRRKEADETALRLQKEAVDPISKATKAKNDALMLAKIAHEKEMQLIERKHIEALRRLKALRISRLDKAQNEFVLARDKAKRVFDSVAGPAGAKLEVLLTAVANDLANKIIDAGKEYTPAMSEAKARRLEAEAKDRARKEREAEELAAVKAAAKAAQAEKDDEKVITGS